MHTLLASEPTATTPVSTANKHDTSWANEAFSPMHMTILNRLHMKNQNTREIYKRKFLKFWPAENQVRIKGNCPFASSSCWGGASPEQGTRLLSGIGNLAVPGEDEGSISLHLLQGKAQDGRGEIYLCNRHVLPYTRCTRTWSC
jgi:hypothetical protein